MTYKNYSSGLLVRLVLLMLVSWNMFYFVFEKEWYVSGVILLVIFIFQFLEMYRLIQKTNREISRLFDSVRHSDFSLHFAEKPEGAGFDQLHSALNDMVSAYRKVKVEKEQYFHHLEQVVEYLHTGIISYREDGHIELMNSAALELLGVPRFHEWSVLKSRKANWTREIESLPFHEQRSLESKEAGIVSPQLIYKSKIILGGNEHVIISFQGIKDEVERQEVKAYHKLIRILTHEIMNTITPIASLSETLKNVVADKNKNPSERLDIEEVADLEQGLDTIYRRSLGMLDFVENYRKLTRLPQPQSKWHSLEEWWNSLSPLLSGLERNQQKVQLYFETQFRNKKALFDAALLEQVVINLVKNSIEAIPVNESGKIYISLNAHGEEWFIQVADNGKGVEADKVNQLFIPFFSTKQNGSGIGLSLSKSIVQSHRGKLQLIPSESGALFEIRLPISPVF